MIFPKPQATLPPHCMTLKGRLKAVILLRVANLIEGSIQLDENSHQDLCCVWSVTNLQVVQISMLGIFKCV